MKKITKAHIVGKFQNRTALGMMTAYIAMHPSIASVDELRNQFPMKDICPDAGIEHLFFSESEINELMTTGKDWFVNGNACFTKEGEWLVLGNGEKVAFNKVWSAKSLEKLQLVLAEYGITGEVGEADKSAAGFEICFESVEVHVTAKFQNRTALGMMAAYVTLNPSVTVEKLHEQFPMKDICPDAGIEKLFFDEKEINELVVTGKDWFVNGNACFTKEGEWLVLGNGEKVAFNKVWSAKSLEKLQVALAEHGITGEVGTVDNSATAGYVIDFDNSTQTIVF